MEDEPHHMVDSELKFFEGALDKVIISISDLVKII